MQVQNDFTHAETCMINKTKYIAAGNYQTYADVTVGSKSGTKETLLFGPVIKTDSPFCPYSN